MAFLQRWDGILRLEWPHRIGRTCSPLSGCGVILCSEFVYLSVRLQVSHAAAMSRLGRPLQTSNTLRAVLRTCRYQRPPLRPLKLMRAVQIVTAGTQIRPRRCRGPGRDGLASNFQQEFQTSRSACPDHSGDVLKSRTRARWSGLVGGAPYLRDDMWLSMLWSNYV
ncbi:hypothetical protein H4582DRAFT_1490210 [Lactarius indigo]|nr:hypothetical protein H4582DRAFT_1490210 [Lactarius indigo]